MIDLRELDGFRIIGTRTPGDATEGAFAIPSPLDGVLLRIIASTGLGWDHVSVSRAYSCPAWGEMEAVKRMFFQPTEVAMQLHVATDNHINVHPYCLHLWRPHITPIPLPPSIMVA